MADPGYRWKDGHPQRRAALVAQLARDGYLVCWRCESKGVTDGSQYIYAAEDMHVGHDDHDRSITRGPEHKGCNLRAAAAKTNGTLGVVHSRNWWP